MKTNTITTAKPFVKWLGGKTKLLPQLTDLLPESYNKYYEPFVGGGALFFSLKPARAVINDLNPHLINLYIQVRDNLDVLLEQVEELLDIYLDLEPDERSDFFYEKREEFNKRTDDDVRGAVLFLFLNKTCYNGVYRENAGGKFNVPFGRRATTTLHELDSIKQASKVLKGASIFKGSYEEVLVKATTGDLVYLDPPYVPLSSTSNFTQYIGANFGNSEHVKLRDLFKELDQRGCYLMMSNSDTTIVRDLYEGFNFTEVLADRAVNCKTYGRGRITELVITNY
ncbi:MAG TPA: DNA adenine methylase [Patescibacteria group bacterium]|nr:DNA adenine methylase [Patescibacteria group bacterium]